MTSEREIIKIRVHDGIVGLLYLGSIALAQQFNIDWIYVAIGVAVLQIISPFTKFCSDFTSDSDRASAKFYCFHADFYYIAEFS